VQRKDGRWQILIRHTYTDGVRKRATVTGKTAKETRQKAEEVRARLKKGCQPATPGSWSTSTPRRGGS